MNYETMINIEKIYLIYMAHASAINCEWQGYDDIIDRTCGDLIDLWIYGEIEIEL